MASILQLLHRSPARCPGSPGPGHATGCKVLFLFLLNGRIYDVPLFNCFASMKINAFPISHMVLFCENLLARSCLLPGKVVVLIMVDTFC